MKLSKKVLPKVIIIFSATSILLLVAFFLLKPLHNLQNPTTDSNQNYLDFKKSLQLSKLSDQVSQIEYRPFFNEIEFVLNDQQGSTTVILNSQKNIYKQVAALQKTLIIAKMENKHLSFIDLSLKHPYATLKNN